MERDPTKAENTAEPSGGQPGEAVGETMLTMRPGLPEEVSEAEFEDTITRLVEQRVAHITDSGQRANVAAAYEVELRDRLPYMWQVQARIIRRRSA